jgi:hypothetical protein
MSRTKLRLFSITYIFKFYQKVTANCIPLSGYVLTRNEVKKEEKLNLYASTHRQALTHADETGKGGQGNCGWEDKFKCK